MQPELLLFSGVLLLVVAGVLAWLWRKLAQRRRALDERIQSQVETWEHECPVEVLGGKLVPLPGAKPGVAFVLIFWNNSGIPCRSVTLRLLALREGLDLTPAKARSPARPMPLKLLPAAELNDHRTGARSRPLARMKLAPYERGEIEVAWIDEDEGTLTVQHEVGEVVFPLSAVDYEFGLELTGGECREVLTIGIKRLADDGKWVSSMPKTSKKLSQARRSRR